VLHTLVIVESKHITTMWYFFNFWLLLCLNSFWKYIQLSNVGTNQNKKKNI